VDKARIGVTGGSQGGALSLIAGAGRPEVRAIAADVPFMTSIRDALKLGSSYPYEEVKDYLRLQPTYEEKALATLDYFDTVNFADQIKAPTLLSIGLRDDICPPQTGYALYNRLSCPKELRVYPDAGHEGGGFVHAQLKTEWLGQQLST
jgi:cephalosporin-C deacetylase